MSTKPQSPFSTLTDLDATADYPQLAPLAPAAPADTWVMPQLAEAPVIDDLLRAHQEEIGTLRQSLVAVTTNRDQLRTDLNALTAKLHELRPLLLAKDAQHSHQERDLRAHQEEIGTLRQSLAAATTSRDELQANLTALMSKTRDLEQRPRDDHVQRSEHERELGERDRRLAELAQELVTRDEQQRLDGAERDELRAQLKRAEANLIGVTQLRERQASVQLDAERERALREAALARSQEDLTDLQRRIAGHSEALHRAETRRQVFDAMLREREEMLDERDARLRALQDELNAHRRAHGAALERATTELAAAVARAGEAERHLAEQRQRSQARDIESTSGGAVAPGPDPDSQRRIAALEAQLADLHEAERTLQKQLQGAQHANEALRADLSAAELQIRAADGELRQSKVRLALLEANSPAAAPSLRTRERLLVRTAGDVGIVHLLGRRTTIGRTPDNDLRIEADFISRHHAVVLVTESSTVVEDLHSTNGVFINNIRVARHELREGDLLTIGTTSFRYVLKPLADQG